MTLTIGRLRDLVRGKALPGSIACVQGTCNQSLKADGEVQDGCSCKLILAELGITAETVTPVERKVVEKVLDAAEACGPECAL